MKEYDFSQHRDGDLDAIAWSTPEHLCAVERLVASTHASLRAAGAAAIVLSGLRPTPDAKVPAGREGVVIQARIEGPAHYLLTMLGDALSEELIIIGRAHGLAHAFAFYSSLMAQTWTAVQQQLASDGRPETP